MDILNQMLADNKLPKKPRDLYEKEIERAVCKYAISKGSQVRKFTSPMYRSVPDRIFSQSWHPTFYIEFKRQGKEATPKQLREHERLRAIGSKVFVIDNVEAGKRLIDELYENY